MWYLRHLNDFAFISRHWDVPGAYPHSNAIIRKLITLGKLRHKGSSVPSSNLITSLFVLKEPMMFPYIQQPKIVFLLVFNAL